MTSGHQGKSTEGTKREKQVTGSPKTFMNHTGKLRMSTAEKSEARLESGCLYMVIYYFRIFGGLSAALELPTSLRGLRDRPWRRLFLDSLPFWLYKTGHLTWWIPRRFERLSAEFEILYVADCPSPRSVVEFEVSMASDSSRYSL
jgi:hypothetical protein